MTRSGHVLETGGRVHLKLPTRFESKKRCITVIGWGDPRTKEGELLNPALWDEEAIDLEEQRLKTFGFSGQHQQEPVPKGGGQFQRVWFTVEEAEPTDFVELARFWDTAATEGGGDWTAGVKMGRRENGDVWILDVKHKQFSSGKVDELIRQTAQVGGPYCAVREEEEPGASGKTVTMDRARKLFGYDYKGIPATGRPEIRCEPFSAACEAGIVYVKKAAWNADFLDEVCNFPRATHDDQTIAAAGAFNDLVVTVGEIRTIPLSEGG